MAGRSIGLVQEYQKTMLHYASFLGPRLGSQPYDILYGSVPLLSPNRNVAFQMIICDAEVEDYDYFNHLIFTLSSIYSALEAHIYRFALSSP